MEAVFVPIAVAVIAGPLMWVLTKLDRNNTKQHGQSIQVLRRVEAKVDRLDYKTDHLDNKVLHIDKKVADVHERLESLEIHKPPMKPKT